MPKGVYVRTVNPIRTLRRTPIRPLAERFWEKVDKRGPDECWPWTGWTDRKGYGYLRRGSAESGHVAAIRVSLELALGEPLGDRYALHRCDNSICVNPAHLYPGDAKKNAADRMERSPHHLKGEAIHSSKLTAEIVIELRRLHALGMLRVAGAARHYGVSQVTIWDALTRRTWKHL